MKYKEHIEGSIMANTQEIQGGEHGEIFYVVPANVATAIAMEACQIAAGEMASAITAKKKLDIAAQILSGMVGQRHGQTLERTVTLALEITDELLKQAIDRGQNGEDTQG